MTQAALYIACFATGLACNLAIGLGRRPTLAVAAAFPLGLAILVTEVMVWLLVGLPLAGWAVCLLLGLPFAVGTTVAARRGLPSARLLAPLTLLLVALTAVISSLNHAWFTYDSHQLLYQAHYIGRWHDLPWGAFGSWGSFMIVAHALMGPIDVPYLFGLAPMLGLSTVALWVAILTSVLGTHHGEGKLSRSTKWRVSLIAAVLTLTFTFALHVVYVHTNMPSALYLLGFVGLYWIAEIDRSRATAALAMFFLFAFSLMRLESPLVACVFVALTLFVGDLQRRDRVVPLLLFCALLCGWLIVLSMHLPAESKFLTRGQARIMALIVLTFSVYGIFSDLGWLARLRRWIPPLALFSVASGLGLAFLLDPSHMMESTSAALRNLFAQWQWAGIWWLLPATAIMSRWAPTRFPVPASLSHGTWVFLGVVALLGFARDPYRVHSGDSASRMALHVFPLLMLYLGARFIPIANDAEPPART